MKAGEGPSAALRGWQGSGQACCRHHPQGWSPPGRGRGDSVFGSLHSPLPGSPQVCTEDLPGARELSSLGPRVQPAAHWGPVLPGCAMGPPNLSAPLTGPRFPHHKMKGPSSRSHTLTPVGGPGVCVGDKPRSRTRFSTLAGWGLGTTVGGGEGAQTSEQAPQPGVREKRVHEGQAALCPRTWEGRGAGRHPAGGAGR